MSTTVYSYLIEGIKVPVDSLYLIYPNPLYGKYKFDPNTGKPVHSTIRDKSFYNELYSMLEKASIEPIEFYEKHDIEYLMFGVKHGCTSSYEPRIQSINISKIVNPEIPEVMIEIEKKFQSLKISYEKGLFLITSY